MEQWEIEAQLAGMTRDGNFDRLCRPGFEVLIPDGLRVLDRDGDPFLTYTDDPHGGVFAPIRPGALDAFLRLADGEAHRILSFAQKWGPLRLCICGLPAAHPMDASSLAWRWGEFTSRYMSRKRCGGTETEFLKHWTYFARAAQAIVSIAVRLGRGELGAREDWEAIRDPQFVEGPPRTEAILRDATRQRGELTRLVNNWLALGRVRPWFAWNLKGTTSEIRLGGGGVFGTIARDVAFAVARVDGLVICAGCGAGFSPSRRPASGRRSWCKPCKRSGADVRQAKRDERARKRALLGRTGGVL